MSELQTRALLDPVQAAERDRQKWRAEGHKRLATPLTTLSYAMVALFSALGGIFRRQGGIARPLATVGAMIALLALGFIFSNLAVRNNALLVLVWLHAVLPGVFCALRLFGPTLPELFRRAAEA
jgi:lipopolysaccharide export system permease protein